MEILPKRRGTTKVCSYPKPSYKEEEEEEEEQEEEGEEENRYPKSVLSNMMTQNYKKETSKYRKRS